MAGRLTVLPLHDSFDGPGPTPQERAAQARELLAAGRAAEALAAAELALAAAPDLAPALAARAAAVLKLEAGDPRLTALELTAVIQGENPEAQLDLAHAYVEEGRPADAERYFKRALAVAPRHAAAHAGLGALYLTVGIEDGAEHHSRLALRCDPGHALASQTLAEILERRGESKAAYALLDEAYSRQSLFREPAAQSRMTVLVLSTETAGNIPYKHLLPAAHYTRLIWYMEHAKEAQFASLPTYDVVFNAIGDPDLAGASSDMVRRFLARCGKKALNDPARVAQTSRSLIPTTLGELEDVVAPAAARIGHDAIVRLGLRRAIARSGLKPPLLVRPIGSHGGRGLELARTWEALESAAAVSDGAEPDLYVTDFHDYRSTDGLYRKGRVVFVDRKPFPYHWAASDQWMVHYDASGTGSDPARRAEEQRMLEDPEAALGQRAWAAITAIGERLDLDYCGLDFSVLPDGRVLVFEANATMLVHPEDETGPLAHKNPMVRAITEAFQARLGALA
jgi:tetratricopeptide (TPR) repeat protein